MKIVYFDCASGISGDMTLGALVDSGVDLAAIQAGVDSLGLPDCRLVTREVKKEGFRATQLTVEHAPEKAHRHLSSIVKMIDASRLSDSQKDLARRIFHRLAEAEAKVHGTTVEKVHFHEVGAVDSIADIVGSAIALDLLGADRVVCSPIPTGHGFVKIAHGRCSIPAPATAELLVGVPLAASSAQAELTTPTGAAIVATVVDEFGPMPEMTVESIGCGAGERDLAGQPNLLRVFVGRGESDLTTDRVWMLETNLDDISGEVVGYCTTLLLDAGALDVFTTPIQMKKNRPGVTLSVLCGAGDVSKMEAILFRETTTLGVRRWPVSRHKLPRQPHVVNASWGPVEGKLAVLPDGESRFSPEYESCRRIAAEKNVSLRKVYDDASKAFLASRLSE